MILARFIDMGGFECVLAVVVIGALIAVAWNSRARSRDLTQAFGSVARWFHGRVQSRGWGSAPLLRIPYNQATLDITTSVAENGRRCTEATLQWPEFTTNVRVLSKVTTLNWASGGKVRIQIGEPDFERQFNIIAEEPDHAKAILTGGVRAALVMLARVRGGAIDVRFADGQLVVQKLAILDQAVELSAFVRHTMELFDQAMLSRSVGIEFVEQLGFQSLEEAKCPVCLANIADDMVFCGRCKTPHHRECWVYSGKCATYGCGETQFVVPRISKPR